MPGPIAIPDPSPLVARRARRVIAWLVTALLLIDSLGPAAARAETNAGLSNDQAARFAEQALAWRRQLSDQVMPYWYNHSIDPDHGGYVLDDAVSPEKLVVTQARLIWGFAHAYRLGLRDPKREYLGTAEQGYRFLLAHFLDRENGGYFWTTDRPGQPVDARKFLYGQAAVIFALVEYYRASGDSEALGHATDLYRTVQAHCRDPENGGWNEHFERDWRPITGEETPVDIGIVGMKSGETLLQWMEALTQLDQTTRAAMGESAVRDLGLDEALAEALDLNATEFFPARPGQAFQYRYPDWGRPIGPRFKAISYGHNVEFAWQMLAAERALGRPLSWDRFDALVQHALAYGFDRERGGLAQLGFENRRAIVTDKVWWVQAELLAALTESLSQRRNPDYAAALEKLLGFLTAHQIDPRDGIWFDTVAADGSLRRSDKAHNWKTNYHDLRAMMKFVAAFGPGFGTQQARVR